MTLPTPPNERPPGEGPTSAGPASDGRPREMPGPPVRRRRWRVRLLGRGAALLVLVVVLEYVGLPALASATSHLDILRRLQPAWLAVGVTCEVASLLAYALLLRAVLPEGALGLWRLFRIVLATMAVSHVVPAGGAGSAGAGFRLLTTSGVGAADAGFALATVAIGSAVVLNLMLWVALLISIPLTGFHPVYVVVQLLGLLGLLGAAALTFTFTRGEARAVRAVRAVGDRIPRVGADRLEQVVRQLASSLDRLGGDRRVLARAAGWAAANWLLDAACLWCFLAALGSIVEPFELFVAYGIANVLAAIPITPGGLGVVEASAPALLLGFGVPRGAATFGVLGWRVVSFWLPIPLGALAYVSLRVRGRRDDGDDRLTPSSPDRLTD